MSNRTAISVETLGKSYWLDRQLHRQPYESLREVATAKLKSYFRFGGRSRDMAPKENFWALKDVSFEIKQGNSVGIIGRNGAGKSTLLKILSRITDPTEGRVRFNGRLASLLEVGTGFHPELSGRENVFLNGAILGMSRAEIKGKFDEIVAFANIDRFLDTPVKFYSSGMYVRLAFAVAAHLEPEILVVDEVLAVGDADFQRKCLGKINEASLGGRTVILVSHSMQAIKSMTTQAIVLEAGRIVFDGPTNQAIQRYIELDSGAPGSSKRKNSPRGSHAVVHALRLINTDQVTTSQYLHGTPFRFEIEIETDGAPGISIEVFLADATRSPIGMASTYHFHGRTLPDRKGVYLCEFDLGPLFLASGAYALEVSTSLANISWDHSVKLALEFEVPFSNPRAREFDFKQAYGFGALALPSAEPRFTLIPTVAESDYDTAAYIS